MYPFIMLFYSSYSDLQYMNPFIMLFYPSAAF